MAICSRHNSLENAIGQFETCCELAQMLCKSYISLQIATAASGLAMTNTMMQTEQSLAQEGIEVGVGGQEGFEVVVHDDGIAACAFARRKRGNLDAQRLQTLGIVRG